MADTLNNAQMAAVQHLGSPCLVLAGRGLGQDPGDHAQDRAAAAARAAPVGDRGHHLHQQGGAGDARARQGPGRWQGREGPADQHLPLAGGAAAARRRCPPGPEAQLQHPGQRRRAGRAEGGRWQQRQRAGAQLAMDHQPVEEPGAERRRRRGRGSQRRRAGGRARDGALPGAAGGLPGGGLRRPDRPAAGAAAARCRSARQVAAAPETRAGGRGAGHQRRAVRTAQGPGG